MNNTGITNPSVNERQRSRKSQIVTMGKWIYEAENGELVATMSGCALAV
jgi:hypothetical protein